ncbi:hypothetical protein HMPREF1624_04128 [Sporothrix schenckii ATCC 58251]|uniref:Uncharacterized protein n=1 Tax=Sporothrix schenckii (strain ATCC 58251 / de Perez 2211183) TaxID=1391915 RepID=U7PWV3_SPOS1|nr:hypothetical protein HMPREF1624_04128 [Sporothrix schenckii ATCC 58251]
MDGYPTRRPTRRALVNTFSTRKATSSVVARTPTLETTAPLANATTVTESQSTPGPPTQMWEESESAPAAIPGKANKPESVSIPTITITGSVTSLPLAGASVDMGKALSKDLSKDLSLDGAITESHCRPTRAPERSTPTVSMAPRTEFRLQNRSMRPSSASSHQNAEPSGSSSASDLPLETATNVTTSSRRLAVSMKMRVEKLSPSTQHKRDAPCTSAANVNCMQRRSNGINKEHLPETFSFLRKIMPPPSIPPPPLVAKMQHQKLAIPITLPTQEMAQGAAYMAVARTGRLPRNRIQQNTVAGMDIKSPTQLGKQKQQQNGVGKQPKQNKRAAGTGGPTVPMTTRKRKQQTNNHQCDDANVPLELIQKAGVMMFRLLLQYWTHVRPVFHRRSALRGRLRRGCLTFTDAFLCVQAAGFVLTLVMVSVVVFRVLVVVGICCHYTSGMMSFLLGM